MRSETGARAYWRLGADAIHGHRLARQLAVEDLPADTLGFLLGSRYCETDLLSQIAWNIFGHYAPGWERVQAICDFVHNHSPSAMSMLVRAGRRGKHTTSG
jgi:transglutaminase-like putative cysteine protease